MTLYLTLPLVGSIPLIYLTLIYLGVDLNGLTEYEEPKENKFFEKPISFSSEKDPLQTDFYA